MPIYNTSRPRKRLQRSRFLLLAIPLTFCPAGMAQMNAPDTTGKTSNERFMRGPAAVNGISAEAAQRGPETDAPAMVKPTRPSVAAGLDIGTVMPFMTFIIGASCVGVAMYMKKAKTG